MDEKTLYYELLNDMENILKKHNKTQEENLVFDPTQYIPVEPENIGNPEQFRPIGNLITSIDNLCRKAGVCKE